MTTFAGPMAAYDFGAAAPSAFTLRSLLRACSAPTTRASTARSPGPTSIARGRCGAATWRWSRISSARRTWPDIDGGILFLEDIGEQPYRVERMLHQLHFAGVLRRQQRRPAAASSTATRPARNDNGYDFDAVIAHARAHFGVPILTGLPFGHCPDKLTLPVGGHCALDRARRARRGWRFPATGELTPPMPRASTSRERCASHACRRSIRNRNSTSPVGAPAGSKLRSMKRASPSCVIASTVEQRVPYVVADDERRRQHRSCASGMPVCGSSLSAASCRAPRIANSGSTSAAPAAAPPRTTRRRRPWCAPPWATACPAGRWRCRGCPARARALAAPDSFPSARRRCRRRAD